jgi:hypothetical protein
MVDIAVFQVLAQDLFCPVMTDQVPTHRGIVAESGGICKLHEIPGSFNPEAHFEGWEPRPSHWCPVRGQR